MTTVDIDGEDASDGLLSLVVAVVELLVEAMEREAIRRMESGKLSDEQIEQLGRQLQAIEAEIDDIKETSDIEDDVDNVRSELDGIVDDALRMVDTEAATAGTGRGTVTDTPTAAEEGRQR
ncbi:gas vesicle protein GvpK [Haloarcula nitratireducens]|uniref:Gas vesicle protein K n=1 Tax=Haloarcula nitratireducens TaxID=2487749 RepID=A0AAW4PD95_9EURY|nr:gas vesicle protein GvpK [Halomicroarcula nitratireducens]MBX0296211.1 gas vesicle protein K [Halomicroarcula nitratireducens]